MTLPTSSAILLFNPLMFRCDVRRAMTALWRKVGSAQAA
jgi:hypothetical protein